MNRSLYRNYLTKSEDSLEIATLALGRSKHAVAVSNSVHCGISAVDALAVFKFGRRHTGGHEGALRFVQGALSDGEFKELSREYAMLMRLKNEAEYQPDLMTPAQARDSLARAGRILSTVKGKIAAT